VIHKWFNLNVCIFGYTKPRYAVALSMIVLLEVQRASRQLIYATVIAHFAD